MQCNLFYLSFVSIVVMSGFVINVKVNTPADKAFELYLNEDIMPHWISGFKGIEILRGEPREPDSLYRMFIDFNGENLKIYQKLIEVCPHEKILVEMEHPEFFTYSEIQFKQNNHITELFCKVKIEGKNLKMKLAMPLVKSILEDRNQKDYLIFKEVVEKKGDSLFKA